MALDGTGDSAVHTIAVVIPVYLGESTLPSVVKELLPFTDVSVTEERVPFRIAEIVLVHDDGPDHSDDVIRQLAAEHEIVRPVWLARNFGQHPATLAGMASTASDWIVTMDEDGQHDPADIPRFLDAAIVNNAQLVYASPTNPAPHGVLRNSASNTAKWLATHLLTSGRLPRFHSFRLILGEPGRGVAAYVGPGVYLDVALSWVVGRTTSCAATLRSEGDRKSGYSFRKLLSHFWQLVITSGTRPLRLVSLLGLLLAISGFVLALVVAIGRITNQINVEGWTSVMVAVLVIGGAILVSLGVISEYLGAAVRMAMGKPTYLIVGDPVDGPLHRRGAIKPDNTA